VKDYSQEIGDLMNTKAENVLANAEKIDVGDDWFEVLRLPKNTFAIRENGHVQEVCSFLIEGNEKAILFDTGMGIGDISAVVQQISDQDLIVVNSHSHFDHIGSNWQFPLIHIFDDELALAALTEGFSHWDVRYDSDPEFFTKAGPSGFDPGHYAIKPIERDKIQLLHDGDTFDLGNRQLEVVHAPGHSQDSIMLLDKENRLLFTSDVYCGRLFVFFDSRLPKYGYSNLEAYVKTMGIAAGLVPELEYIFPSHARPLVDPSELTLAAKALKKIIGGEADFYHEEFYGDLRRVYTFGEISIWI
jgi:glyoxylase-like metal-dependent hydrolase (beta-lactamase superfamily II)